MATSCLNLLVLLRRFLLPVAVLLGVAQSHAGLLLHYKFDETSGTIANDSSGNGNRGWLINMTGSEWSTGRVGGALDFDGSNDYVQLASVPNSLITNMGDVTFAAWIYRKGTNTNYGEIFVSQNILSFSIRHSDNKLHFNLGDGAGWVGSVNSGSTIPMNQWVHVAATRSGSDTKVYVDGVLEGSDTNNGSGIPPYAFALGAKAGFFNRFTGLIDEARMYDHALSASEISALASMGGSGAPEPAEIFAFLGLLTACGLGYREWRFRRKAKAA